MSEFRLDWEWEESPHARAPELRATWARFEIHINGSPVTKVEDRRSRGVRDGIYVPLYPVAEWLVSNWWFLWHEWGPKGSESHHNLLTAREGFALPNLSFIPTETQMHLDWKSTCPSDFDRVSFLLNGSELLPKDLVQTEARRFIDAVTQRLSDRDFAETFLTSEWESVLAAERDPEQRRFCEQAAHLSIDPFNPEGSIADSLEQLDSLLPASVIDDFCDAVRWNEIPVGVQAVREFLSSLDVDGVSNQRWHALREQLAVSNGVAPWKYGYSQAQKLRSYLDIHGPVQGDLIPLLRQALTGFEIRRLDAPIGIEAIAASGESEHAGFGITKRANREESQRFLLCRALSDFLASHRPSLVTNAPTEHQQRNRAFAAEFLAPATAIRDRLPSDILSEDDLGSLADEFMVSPFVIRHQIENHKLAVIAV